MRKAVQLGFTMALVVICLLPLGRSTYDQVRLSREIAELTSGVHLMKPHSTFSIRCPDWHKSPALGKVEYVTPYVHAMAFYGLYHHDVGHLSNYEASYNYFPINHYHSQSYAGQEDYIVAWMYPENETFVDLTPNYDLIYQSTNKYLHLFRRKEAGAVDLSQWRRQEDETSMIQFDFQPIGGAVAKGHCAIHKDSAYVSGRFGWVTRSPHQQHQGNRKIGADVLDFVFDTDDAAFKIDLPNGTYKVTNYFCSTDGGQTPGEFAGQWPAEN